MKNYVLAFDHNMSNLNINYFRFDIKKFQGYKNEQIF